MSLRGFTSVALSAGVIAAIAACGDLKTAPRGSDAGTSTDPANPTEPGPGSSGGTSGNAGSSGTSAGDQRKTEPPAGFGPGLHGALPSGYCCNDDSECRSRHCEDGGGGKTCLDICYSSSSCARPPDFMWTCDNGGTPGDEGLCKPSGAFTCIPAAQFETGTKVPGECCTATGDGYAGLECEGGRCIAIGDSPFVCTHACVQPKDCPKGFVCQQITDTRKECIPANRPYTCD